MELSQQTFQRRFNVVSTLKQRCVRQCVRQCGFEQRYTNPSKHFNVGSTLLLG